MSTITEKLLNPEDTSSCVSNEEKAPIYAFNGIRLMPGATKLNFFCSLMFMVIMVFGIAGAGNLQLLILLDPSYYNLPQDHMGTTNSMLLAIQTVVKIITVVPYGHLSDKIGRRTIIFIASLSFLASCIIIPMQKTMFPGFFIATILSANAGAAFSSVPLLADYVADESKGKAAAIYGVIGCTTALLSNLFMKALFYLEFQLGTCYFIVGGTTFALFLLNNLGLQKGTFHLKALSQMGSVVKTTEEEPAQKSFTENMKEALQVFKGNNWLKISLVLQILGSSDFIVIMSFISLYVKSLFSADTPVVDQNTAVNNLQSLILVMMMVSNFVCAYVIDKKNMIIQPCLVALGGGVASLILLALSFKPTAWTLYTGVVLFGLTMPGLGTITNLINLKNFPADKRGVTNGFCQLVSTSSYFVIAGGGGLLYDNWRRNGPFVVCAGLLVFAAFVILIIYSRIVKENSRKSSSSSKVSIIVKDHETPEQGGTTNE